MSKIGQYGAGSVSSFEYNTVDDLLSEIPDNLTNQIKAHDVRDSIYTLWKRIDYLDNTVNTAIANNGGFSYSNTKPMPFSVGGLPIGTTFSNISLKELWDDLLYPYVNPTINITTPRLEMSHDYKISTNKKVTINIIKGSENINSIVLSYTTNDITTTIDIPTDTTSKEFIIISVDANATDFTDHSKIYVLQNVNTPLTIKTIDNVKTLTTNSIIVWDVASYYGAVDYLYVEHSNPSIIFNSFDESIDKPTWTSALGVVNIPNNNDGKIYPFATSQNYDGINANGKYLLFALPIDSTQKIPQITINGLINNDFINIGNGEFRVGDGGEAKTVKYSLWENGTVQYGSIDKFNITIKNITN